MLEHAKHRGELLVQFGYDTSIVDAIPEVATGGVVLVGTDSPMPQLASMAPTPDPAGVGLFPRPTKSSKLLPERFGVARADNIDMVRGLTGQLLDILRHPERIQRGAGIIAVLPNYTEQAGDTSPVTTSLVLLRRKPLSDLTVSSLKLAVGQRHGEITVTETAADVELAIRAARSVLRQRQSEQVQRWQDTQTTPPQRPGDGRGSPWATRRHKPGPAKHRN